MKYLLITLFLSLSSQAATTYEIKESLAKYTVKHLLKTVSGESKEIKGKGVCDKSACEFLLAVPVKSFDSANTNRDLHMLEVMKGAKYPLVVARVTFPESAFKSKNWSGEVELDLAGIKKKIPLTLEISEKDLFIHGDFVFKCSDFQIERPSLLTVAIDDDVKMTVNTTWLKK